MSQYLDKDGASRIAENFLSKQAEQDAILKNLQFDLKEAEHALVKTIQGPAPLNIRALTRPLDDYVIGGNTVQDGTPSPDAPVDVVGCGERTGNLFDESAFYSSITGITQQGTFSISGGTLTVSSGNENVAYTMPFQPGYGAYRLYVQQDTTYYVNFENSENSRLLMFKNGLASEVISMVHPTTLRTDSDTEFYTLRFGTVSTVTSPVTIWIKNIMLNYGSTALPYEPYGYKLPLIVNDTECPIYLGQVPTTRRIRKLVLTGEEDWAVNNNTKVFYCDISQALLVDDVLTSACTHYVASENKSNYAYLSDNSCCIRWNMSTLWIHDTARTYVDAFKSYLQQQYSSGTPVTVWYVLAEPETGIFNEPLHKIGDYADTISMAQAGVEISTTKGFNAITTDTTVLPSNIEVKGVINNA